MPRNKPSVVIAEDEAVLAYTLQRLLEAEYEIIAVVGDGQAAIEAAETHHPDVFLMDISMPVMNGLDAAKRIAQSCPSVRIIFVTSYTDRAHVEGAFERGASGYVAKGSVAELETAMRTVLNGGEHRPHFTR